MRRIGIVTLGRSDYGTFVPILRAMRSDLDLEPRIFATSMHLSPEYGLTVQEIEADGFAIYERIDMLVSANTPAGVSKSLGVGTIGFAQSFARSQPDILLLVGDRAELLAVAAAALPFNIPLAHVSGGDVTEGAIDNQVRNAISKLSHLHFVSMHEHARRLLQMGEEPWRVVVTGEPALDLIQHSKLLSRSELRASLGLELNPPVLVVTHHPATLGSTNVTEEIDSLLSALGQVSGTLVLIHPNSDVDSVIITDRLRAFTATHTNARLYKSLGQLRYYSLLAQADLMVGNSSSGIWEAPSFHLPVVNVGDRQRGRLRAENVIDARANSESIYSAIVRGLTQHFRRALRDMVNPYGDGQSATRVVDVLKSTELGPHLLQKKFVELSSAN